MRERGAAHAHAPKRGCRNHECIASRRVSSRSGVVAHDVADHDCIVRPSDDGTIEKSRHPRLARRHREPRSTSRIRCTGEWVAGNRADIAMECMMGVRRAHGSRRTDRGEYYEARMKAAGALIIVIAEGAPSRRGTMTLMLLWGLMMAVPRRSSGMPPGVAATGAF